MDRMWFARARLLHCRVQKKIEQWLSAIIPGYDTYKRMAEEKLKHENRAAALHKRAHQSG